MSKYELPPKGIYHTVDEWIRKTGMRHTKQIYNEIHKQNKITLNTPRHLGELVLETFKTPRISPPGFITNISEGRVWGEGCAIITPDNYIIWELSYISVPNPKSHPIFSETNLIKPEYSDENVAILFCEWPDNFYHWIFDVISRIHLIRESGIKVDKYVMKPFSFLSFQQETLDALGIKKEQIIYSNKNLHLKAKNLVIPSREQKVGHPSKWACEFLKNSLMINQAKKTEEKKRIYITREGAWYRKIINEGQILKLLNQYNFEIVKLEEKSIWEQIQIFSNAEVILTLHGAALTNLIFCTPKTKIIELFPPRFIPTCYCVIANLAELDYFYLIGDTENPTNYDKQPDFMDNIFLNPNTLQQLFSIANITN